jgi:transketolase
MNREMSTRDAYGHTLIKIAERDTRIFVLDADLSRSTRTEWFKAHYPDRFLNVGIAEQNLIGIASGLSMSGWIPFATTYAIFIGRAYDQIRQCVGFSNSNVKIVATHAGLAASHDGGSHQGLEDLALMRVIPGMTVIVPADYNEACAAIVAAAAHEGPCYIRLQKEPSPIIMPPNVEFAIGRASLLREGRDVAIAATGTLVGAALAAADHLRESGIMAAVVNVSTIKPLDILTLSEIAAMCGCVLTVEEHNFIGGLHEAVSSALARSFPVPTAAVAVPDLFGTTGSWTDLLESYGLTSTGIAQAAKQLIALKEGTLHEHLPPRNWLPERR